jgi:hypothetical protein
MSRLLSRFLSLSTTHFLLTLSICLAHSIFHVLSPSLIHKILCHHSTNLSLIHSVSHLHTHSLSLTTPPDIHQRFIRCLFSSYSLCHQPNICHPLGLTQPLNPLPTNSSASVTRPLLTHSLSSSKSLTHPLDSSYPYHLCHSLDISHPVTLSVSQSLLFIPFLLTHPISFKYSMYPHPPDLLHPVHFLSPAQPYSHSVSLIH